MIILRCLILIISVQIFSVFAEETFIVGKIYDIPVDCGKDSSIRPVGEIMDTHLSRKNIHDVTKHGGRVNFSNRYEGTLDVSYFGMLEVDAIMPASNTSNSFASNWVVRSHFITLTRTTNRVSENFDISVGCPNGLLEIPTASDNSVSVDANARMSKWIDLQPSGGATNGFHIGAKVFSALSNGANGARFVYIEALCEQEKGRDIYASNFIIDPVIGWHFVSIPIGELTFETCLNDKIRLTLEIQGAGLRLDELQALYYQEF